MKRLQFKDAVALVIAALFLFGCISSSRRTAKTLQPKQVSPTLALGMIQDPDADRPIVLNDLGLHVGVARGAEFGFTHTYDLTEDNDAAYSTIWFDSKFQLNNLANEIGKPMLSIGLNKGYVYDENIEYNITSIPLTFGAEFSESVSGYLRYTHELVSEEFFPDDFEDPRQTVSLGFETAMVKPRADRWIPRLDFSIGLINGPTGGGEFDNLTMGLGLHFDSPFGDSGPYMPVHGED
jgi:hypothetical protein